MCSSSACFDCLPLSLPATLHSRVSDHFAAASVNDSCRGTTEGQKELYYFRFSASRHSEKKDFGHPPQESPVCQRHESNLMTESMVTERPPDAPPVKRGVEVSNKLDKDGTLIKGETRTRAPVVFSLGVSFFQTSPGTQSGCLRDSLPTANVFWFFLRFGAPSPPPPCSTPNQPTHGTT